MNDDELTELTARISALEARVGHDDETRSQLLAATDRMVPTLAKRLEQWEALFAGHLNALKHSPELERLREQGLLPKMATLMTRQTMLEERYWELAGIITAMWKETKESWLEIKTLLEQMKRARGEGEA